MADIEAKLDAALAAAMNSGIEAAATVAEALGDREIAAAIRRLKESHDQSL